MVGKNEDLEFSWIGDARFPPTNAHLTRAICLFAIPIPHCQLRLTAAAPPKPPKALTGRGFANFLWLPCIRLDITSEKIAGAILVKTELLMRLFCLLCQHVLSVWKKMKPWVIICVERRSCGIKARLEEARALEIALCPASPPGRYPMGWSSSIRPRHRLRLHVHKGLNGERRTAPAHISIK
jgi:hypothetical protein